MPAALRAHCSTSALPPCTSGRPCIPPSHMGTCSPSHMRMPPSRRHRQQRMQRGARLVTQMGIRAVENFDSSFELTDEARDTLTSLLSSEVFCKQVAIETCKEGKTLKFTGILFQPVPWSLQTKKGMPTQYEKYLEEPNASVINVPPNYMFKSKIFKPSRLCAIFEVAA